MISAHSLFFYLSKVVCFINVLGNMELIKFKKKKIENCKALSADIKKYEATTLEASSVAKVVFSQFVLSSAN